MDNAEKLLSENAKLPEEVAESHQVYTHIIKFVTNATIYHRCIHIHVDWERET